MYRKLWLMLILEEVIATKKRSLSLGEGSSSPPSR